MSYDYHTEFRATAATSRVQHADGGDDYHAKLRQEFGPYAADAVRIAGDRLGACKNLLDYNELSVDVGVQLRCDMLMQSNVLRIPAELIGFYESIRSALNANGHATAEVVGDGRKLMALQEHLSRIGLWSFSTPLTTAAGEPSSTYRLSASKKDCFRLPAAEPTRPTRL